MKKYCIDKEDSISIGKYHFYRIIALRDFSDVKAGDKGGFIQDEHSLSHEGNCWIYDDAKVSGNSQITENAVVRGTSVVRGEFYIGNNVVVSGNVKLLGSGSFIGSAKVSGDVYAFGKISLGEFAEITGKVYINGRLLLDDNAKLVDGAVVYGECTFSTDSVVGMTVDNLSCYGRVRLLKEEDVVIFKHIGIAPHDSLVAFKDHDGAVTIQYEHFSCGIDKFVKIFDLVIGETEMPNKEAWMKDYKNKINYIRETLTTYSEGFDDI